MIQVKCDECGGVFDVHERFVRVNKRGFVRITAQLVYCPDCPAVFHENDTLDLAGVVGESSGIRFNESQVTIYGDVIGGDQYTVKRK